MPYFHVEAYLILDAKGVGLGEPISKWVQRAGAFMLVLSLAAEFWAIDAKDIAGLGGHTGHGSYGHELIKDEAKWPVSTITIGVVAQIVLGTVLSSHGDMLFNPWWRYVCFVPVLAALLTIAAAGVSIYVKRPIIRLISLLVEQWARNAILIPTI